MDATPCPCSQYQPLLGVAMSKLMFVMRPEERKDTMMKSNKSSNIISVYPVPEIIIFALSLPKLASAPKPSRSKGDKTNATEVRTDPSLP